MKGIDINSRMLEIAQIRADKTKLSQKIEFREMAVAWAFPMSVVFSVVMIPFWRGGILPLVFLVWGLSLLIFVSFPIYSTLLISKEKRIGFIFFNFGRGGFQLLLWIGTILGLVVYSILIKDFSC